ncbi:MAG: hypothetical protein M3O46_17315 [Myxococcota bacterium]|nr:hypothetical protein [Myxococcota bacterium]
MEVDSDARAYDALLQHPRAPDLTAIARSEMTAAAQVKRLELRPDHVAKLAAEMRLSREEATTPFGNALDVLQRGPEDGAERALACALAAHVVAMYPPKDEDDEGRLASDLLWLATHTHFDATALIDRVLGDAAAGLWTAIGKRVLRIDRGAPPALDRGEAIVGGIALASSHAPAALKQAAALAAEVNDRKIARVLGTRAPDGEPLEPILGEMTSAPHGPIATALLAVTGALLVAHVVRLFGRIALAYKRPAQVVLVADGGGRGVRLRWRVEMLGRTLQDRDVLVTRAGLLRATREVRYPRVPLYAGLLSLAAGSYIGMWALVDGVRASSPSLFGIGVAIVALGVALDFALSSLVPSAQGLCRVIFVPREGTTLCIGAVDIARADAMLTRLAR